MLALLGRCTGGRVAVVGGVVEAGGGGLAWVLRGAWAGGGSGGGGASAMTLGHVVVAVDDATLDRSRQHERVHVRQYERWGPLFIPAYLFFSLAAKLRGQNPYYDNRFEREAYAVSHPGRFA